MQKEFRKSYLETFHKVIEEANKRTTKHVILLVDDEPDNLALLRRTLRSKYDVLTATNGQDALQIINEKGADISLIISDQKMPVMQGTEFLAQVTAINPDIVKMLLTGHSDLDILVDSINKCNLFQYIFKPFEPAELDLIVQSAIETFELTKSKKRLLKDLKELFYTTIKSIASALDAKDTVMVNPGFVAVAPSTSAFAKITGVANVDVASGSYFFLQIKGKTIAKSAGNTTKDHYTKLITALKTVTDSGSIVASTNAIINEARTGAGDVSITLLGATSEVAAS